MGALKHVKCQNFLVCCHPNIFKNILVAITYHRYTDIFKNILVANTYHKYPDNILKIMLVANTYHRNPDLDILCG